MGFTFKDLVGKLSPVSDARKKDGAEPVCPKCGEVCDHTPEEMHGFALDALQEASDWYDSLKHTNRADQYLPGCVDGDPETAAFTTQSELMATKWVAVWVNKKDFKRFVLHRIYPGYNSYKAEYFLYAVLDGPNYMEGVDGWPVAFIKSTEGLDIEVIDNGNHK